ncbi:hypothetical protein COZ14_04530 [Candidatus Dojkabacteria bacterium CG_4_10_14_3_um_filter_Dojkabacteria_WS6_41_9]|uniref:Uncharacterized protein n=1 Tax=Candidatus Dojkabacteria bacterium CG_4_10_14_0_2_um_filter_Dojkabacteria_WS6_41_15 TaxID=2014249 RepID=A0A2M7W270_9BACT|nr:MAG: hypothetical protein COZ14_04530 [Candidatus Dojkabacteria bacterium CG_4_10_14_3_um_filter_Dojkabacteria_WS6_41_9]PJA14333.1 MAG: hypothetical protein COX64_02205 [Candidatus Dojkabacteria bacterium CG_4_10_14_0_2_um_filter_Dojkabacteria_WS6_41_15]
MHPNSILHSGVLEQYFPKDHVPIFTSENSEAILEHADHQKPHRKRLSESEKELREERLAKGEAFGFETAQNRLRETLLGNYSVIGFIGFDTRRRYKMFHAVALAILSNEAESIMIELPYDVIPSRTESGLLVLSNERTIAGPDGEQEITNKADMDRFMRLISLRWEEQAHLFLHP